MLDLKQFINQTLSLPLASHKNMVGGLILGLSVLTVSRGERLESSEQQLEALRAQLGPLNEEISSKSTALEESTKCLTYANEQVWSQSFFHF